MSIKSTMKTWQVDITANHLFPLEKGGRVWKETDAKHLLTLDRYPVVGKNSLNSHSPQKIVMRCSTIPKINK